MPHYTGAVVLEDGQKFWARIWVKNTRVGDTFWSLNLKPFQPKSSALARKARHSMNTNRGQRVIDRLSIDKYLESLSEPIK
jgi:hypothetical protein